MPALERFFWDDVLRTIPEICELENISEEYAKELLRRGIHHSFEMHRLSAKEAHKLKMRREYWQKHHKKCDWKHHG